MTTFSTLKWIKEHFAPKRSKSFGIDSMKWYNWECDRHENGHKREDDLLIYGFIMKNRSRDFRMC